MKNNDCTAGLICDLCGGLLTFWGLLGDLAWYRCRQCGMLYSHQVELTEENEEPS